VSSIAWRGNGFYYSRYPQPAKGKELSRSTKITWSTTTHRHAAVGRRAGLPRQKNPQRFHTLRRPKTSASRLDVSDRGTGKQGNAVYVRTSKPGRDVHAADSDIGDDTYNVLESVRGELLVFTDNNAPNGRVVRIDPRSRSPKTGRSSCRRRTTPSTRSPWPAAR
jgi:prolyl oligopeptidase